jgi:hypothetical protein
MLTYRCPMSDRTAEVEMTERILDGFELPPRFWQEMGDDRFAALMAAEGVLSDADVARLRSLGAFTGSAEGGVRVMFRREDMLRLWPPDQPPTGSIASAAAVLRAALARQ